MITIHKFNISSAGTTEVELSSAADIIHCGVQQGIICIWALVDTDFEKEKRTFKVFGTGWDIGKEWDENNEPEHVGTVQIGAYIWHVYETGRY